MISLTLAGLLSACGSNPPKVVTIYKTIEIFRDVYVNPPAEMTAPVSVIVLPKPITAIDLKVGFLEQREAAKLCNNQLYEIANIGNNE